MSACYIANEHVVLRALKHGRTTYEIFSPSPRAPDLSIYPPEFKKSDIVPRMKFTTFVSTGLLASASAFSPSSTGFTTQTFGVGEGTMGRAVSTTGTAHANRKATIVMDGKANGKTYPGSGASAILASHAVSGRTVRVTRRSLAAEAGHVRRSMRGRFRTPSSPIIDPVFSGRFLLISVVSVNSCVVVVYGCMTYVTCRNRFYFQQRACLTRANVAFGTLARRKRFRVIAPVNEGHQDRGSHAAVCLCSSGLDGSAAGNAWLLRSFAAVETSFASFSSTGSN